MLLHSRLREQSEMAIIPRAVERIVRWDDPSHLQRISFTELSIIHVLSNYSVQTTWEILRKLNNATKKCHASLSIVTLCFYFNKNPKHTSEDCDTVWLCLFFCCLQLFQSTGKKTSYLVYVCISRLKSKKGENVCKYFSWLTKIHERYKFKNTVDKS